MEMIDKMAQGQVLLELLKIAGEKKQQLIQMREIIKRQGTFVDEENMDALFESIESRAKCIEIIDKLDDRFSPKYREIESIYKTEGLSDENILLYDRLNKVLDRIYSILKECHEIDTANMTNLRQSQQICANNIRRIQQGSKRQQAYKPNNPIDGGIFIDHKQ